MNKDLMVELGVPELRDVMGLALKLGNTAVHDGFGEEAVRAAVRAAAGLAPGGDFPQALAERFAPLAEAISEVRRGRVAYAPREVPAPWKSWASRDVEAGAFEQMENACSLPVSAGGALMPDAHTGYGLPIGGVLAVRNAVIPYAVGVDIACRMRITVLDVPYGEFERDDTRFAEALEAETRFGVGAKFALAERRSHPVMLEDWSVSPVTAGDLVKAHAQLGTSGAGNHFVEFGRFTAAEDIDEPGLKLRAGTYLALLSHSGSRGLGQDIAQHYSRLAMSLHPELPESLRHLAWLELDSEEGRQYWAAMQLAGRYASANHELIHRHVLARLGAGMLGYVENHHNFAWKESYGGEELIVHRKGATPAAEGVLGVVPGSMGSPGFVVRGKGCEESFRSCSHGAGRKMSRKAAFATLSREAMEGILRERGIRLLSGSLDESPEVYKDIGQVIAAQSDLVDVLGRFDPKLVKMAPEEGDRSWRTRKRRRG